jgi:hypothetical protein
VLLLFHVKVALVEELQVGYIFMSTQAALVYLIRETLAVEDKDRPSLAVAVVQAQEALLEVQAVEDLAATEAQDVQTQLLAHL